MEKTTCPNCGEALFGQYCYHCGQNQKNIDRFFWTLLNETFEDVFSLRSRASTTIFHLLFNPGFLTREYFSGRRARYVPPLRLYLITSVIFFSFLAIASKFSDLQVSVGNDSDVIVLNSEGLQTKPADLESADGEAEVSLDGLEFDFLTADENAELKERLEVQLRKAVKHFKDNPADLVDSILDISPPILFVLVPVFALILKLVYFSHYYTEHLILAVHNHCFVFITSLISNAFGVFDGTMVEPVTSVLNGLLGFWVVVYMYLSLKTCYQQSTSLTFFKYLLLGVSYSVLFLFGFAFALLWGALNV